MLKKLKNRTQRIILLIRCLVRAISRGRANKIPTKVSSIIVAPVGKLGDIVCTTPVFKALRNHFPEARLVAAGNKKSIMPVLDHSGLVDDYIEFSEIEPYKAHVGIVTGPAFDPAAHMYLAGIPFVVGQEAIDGFSPQETIPYKFLKKFIVVAPYKIDEYAPRERLRSLEPLGVTEEDTTKYLGFSEKAEKKVLEFFDDAGITLGKDFVVAISPTAGNKIKEWPEERFAKVADFLVHKYKTRVVIVGGPTDREKVKRTIDMTESKEEIIEALSFNVDELKAFVSKINMFISVDTGPIYIAEAFGIPTINLVGPVDPEVQPPKGPIHRNVLPKAKVAYQLSILNARVYDEEKAQELVLSTDVESACLEIDELMKILNEV